MTIQAARYQALERYRAEFALVRTSTYLNTCSLGALSDRSRAYLERFLGQWDRLGARAWYNHWLDDLQLLRDDLGWTIGRPGGEIALAPSVSVALSSVASALDLVHRGDRRTLGALRGTGLLAGNHARPRVIITALDFPTLGHQWLARAPLGVEVVVLPSPDGLTVPLEAFAAAMDDRTALIATAHVYFTTGARQDIEGLGRLAHERGVLLLIDGYQATGLLPTAVGPADGPDFYVSGTLKWLLGGPGTAFLWVRPELRDSLEPTTTGWFSSARQFEFDVGNLDFAHDGRKFELGTPAVPSAYIARGGLEVVREIGLEAIRQRTQDLGALTIELCDANGLRVRAVRDDMQRGGIVAVEAAEPKPIVDELARRGIVVDYRPGIVRLSPAFYNTEAEVEATVAALAELVPGADRATDRGLGRGFAARESAAPEPAAPKPAARATE